MKKSLPARPNLEHLRSQAKQLLAKLRDGDSAAARVFIEHLPAAKRMTNAQVLAAGFRLADAQSAIARQSGFAAWPALARYVEQLRAWEGEWRFASLEIEAREVPTTMLGEARLLVDGDRFRMESADANYEGIFTIDVETDPAQFDIEFVEGPEAGESISGIYRLDGATLTLCLGVVGATRPTRFATTAGSGHALERLRRASTKQPANVTGGARQSSAAPPAPASVDDSAFMLQSTPLVDALQGEWAPVSLVTNGQALTEEMLRFGVRTVTGNETKVVFGGQVMVHAKMRLDESQSPTAVDYLNIGRGAKTVTAGILALDGDLLRVCMASAGAPRPAQFTSEKGDGHILSEWRKK